MTKYLLDTNILTCLEDLESSVHKKVHQHLVNLRDQDEVFLSILSLYESVLEMKPNSLRPAEAG